MATRDNGLAATLYGPCTVSALAGDGVPVKISTTTDYPFGETIRMRVEPARTAAFPLYIRIPGWCRKAQISVNGSAMPATPDRKGFVKIARTWAKNDVVELQFPMTPRVVRGYETEVPSADRQYFAEFRTPEFFQPRRLPYASVLCGPLLFSLPLADVDPNTPVKDAKWQYALDTDAARCDAGITLEHKPMPAHWDWPLDAPLVLKVSVQSFDWQPSDAHALPDKPVGGTASATVGLVPYGCTKFRILDVPGDGKSMEGSLECISGVATRRNIRMRPRFCGLRPTATIGGRYATKFAPRSKPMSKFSFYAAVSRLICKCAALPLAAAVVALLIQPAGGLEIKAAPPTPYLVQPAFHSAEIRHGQAPRLDSGTDAPRPAKRFRRPSRRTLPRGVQRHLRFGPQSAGKAERRQCRRRRLVEWRDGRQLALRPLHARLPDRRTGRR